MRDTSEFPDATEQQAKPAVARSKTSTRSKAEKTESTTTGGQEPEAKPTTRRRSASTSQSATAHVQNGNDTTAVPSAPTASQTAVPTSEGTPTPPRASNTTTTQAPAEPRPASNTTQPSPQRSGGTSQPRNNNGSTQQGTGTRPPYQPRNNNNNGSNQQGTGTRPPYQPRNNNGSNQQGTGTRPPYQPRNNNGPLPPRNSNAPTQSGPRPSTPYQPRQGGQGGAPQTQQRQGGYAPQQRTGGGSSGPATQQGGSGSAPYQRQGAYRPSGSGGGRSSNYSGGSSRPSGGSGGGRSHTPAQKTQERRAPVVKEKPTGPISIPAQIMVKDLADLLRITPNEAIRGLIKHGVFANINQIVEYEKASLLAQEIGFEPEQSVAGASSQGEKALSANEAMMASRDDDDTIIIPPVVTIMGHVDHGKTSLLDTIRKTKVAAGEAGGITQHIGAYQVEVNGKKITFLDTPGHEAFTAMRARGAQGAHIAIIVVAADDGVMPQTREAIDHARAAKVPIIIALNKIDKANANPDHVKQQLAEIDVVIEEYGGDIVCVPVSARKGLGIDDLLDYILLVAEVQDIRANPNRLANGVIVEARLEKNSGPTATVLVQQGTLKMGDNIVVGALAGKVRAMFNDRAKRIQKAPPSTPVSIIGLPEVPQAGDRLEVVPDERTAKQRAQQEAEKRRDDSGSLGQISLDTLYTQMQEGKVKELDLILKCDVQGSAEALKNALTKVGEENFNKVRLLHEGIGNISETDVHLAAASGAIIIGFNVKADGAAVREAQKAGVDIRYYAVIYKLTDDIQAALVGMLEPTVREVIDGHAEVMQIFKAGKTTVIAGCRITDGKITRASQARIMRKDVKVHEGKIGSLRRGKDDVREVASGYECGIVLEDFTEFEVGDIIEAFSQEKVKAGA